MAARPKKEAPARGAAPVDQLTARFQELIRDVGHAAFGHKRGWQRRLAEAWDMYPAEITNILAGKRRVGIDLATRVATKASLDMRYFTGVGSFTNYTNLGPRGGDPGATHPDQTWDRLQAEARRIDRDRKKHPIAPLMRAIVLAHDILESKPVKLARQLIAAGPPDDVKVAADLVVCVAYDDSGTAEDLDRLEAYLEAEASTTTNVETDNNVSS